MPASDNLLAKLADYGQRLWKLVFDWQNRCPHCGSELVLAWPTVPEDFALGNILYTCEQCGADVPTQFWAISSLND